MSSPFHIFRKHQRAMLVVVGILCMIGFSIAGVIDYSDRSQTRDDPLIATAYGQNLHASEVQQMLRRRTLAINFMAQCKAAELNFPDFAQLFANQFERMYFGPVSDEAVVRTWVLDERARRMGMVIGDDGVNAFIRQQTNDKVKPEVFRDIVQRLGASQPQVFDALRAELLALRLREMALGRMQQTTPAQRWDYYRRQKQRAVVEAAAVRVEDLIGEVADAGDEELQAFFDAHKDREPNPASPTPGFKTPMKADFQVVTAAFSAFYDEGSVTKEEIQKHYDDFKDTRYLWDQYALEGEDDEPEPPADKDDKPEESSDEKAADEKTSDEQKADDKGSKPGEKSQSSLRRRAGLLEVLTRPGVAIAGLLAADDSKPDDGKPDEKTPSDSIKPDDAKPAETTSDTADDKTDKKVKPAKALPVAPQITDEYLLPRDIRKGPHPKHAPLWKVESAIRKELAREKANKKIDEALRAVGEKMRKYSRRLGPEDTESKMPGLDKLAKEQGLTASETGLLSALELKDKHPDLALATGDQRITFLQIAYTGMPKFQTTTVQDIEANRYLAWKVQEVEAFVPDFADVRSKVLRAWKMTKARELAEKKAKGLAEEANKADEPLKQLFADRKDLTVTETPAFSWLTRGTANADSRPPLRISEVEGIDSPGPDFMREVFNLQVGSTGEAMNEPQTAAYVVRLVSLDPPRELLRAGYLAEAFALYNEAAQEDIGEIQQAWLKGIEAEANLTWKDTDLADRRN